MNYYRKIAALLPKHFKKLISGSSKVFSKGFFHYLAQFLFLVLLFQVLVLIATGFVLRYSFEKKRAVVDMRQKEQEYWLKVADQYPNAPDVLYNAAVSSKNVGKEKIALVYVAKALKLDPLFKEAQVLQKDLGK